MEESSTRETKAENKESAEVPAIPVNSEVPPIPLNSAVVKDGVMTVTLYLERSDAGFAEAIGSLDLSKDLVKNYFTQKTLAEAALRARSTMRIIRPSPDGN